MPVRGTNRRAFIAALSGAAGVADGGAGAMMLGNARAGRKLQTECEGPLNWRSHYPKAVPVVIGLLLVVSARMAHASQNRL